MHSATVPAPAATTPHAESIPVQPVPESEAQPARSQPTEPEPHEARPADPQQPAAVAPQHQARRAAPASRPASRRANPAHTETASATAPDPRAELSLLTPARQLLATHPLRSLALAEEHAQRFAHGAFAEERDFLRMEALLRLDRRSEAESAARVFRRQHPQSTHLERIDALLRHP
jgi:hypothetical protein